MKKEENWILRFGFTTGQVRRALQNAPGYVESQSVSDKSTFKGSRINIEVLDLYEEDFKHPTLNNE